MRKLPPMSFGCPHCGAPTNTRTSHALSPLLREVTAACSNRACGHVFVVHASAEQTLVPSMAPAAGVFIPIAESARRTMATLLQQPTDRAASVAAKPRPPARPKPQPTRPGIARSSTKARPVARGDQRAPQTAHLRQLPWYDLARPLTPAERQALPSPAPVPFPRDPTVPDVADTRRRIQPPPGGTAQPAK